MAAFDRNSRSDSVGFTGRFQSERGVGFGRRRHLRAALQDLRQLQGYIHHLGAEPGSVDDPELVELHLLAVELSERLGTEAAQLEEKLGTAPDLES